jgi:hypothetical protein
MQQLRVWDEDCLFEIELRTPFPFSGLEDHRAEPLIQAALLMSVATLLEGGDWPSRALHVLQEFMRQMHDALVEKLPADRTDRR